MKTLSPPLDTELLAPAGCYASLQAAIDSGADSIYFGLAQLNMRARARRSFQLEDLPEIVARCRSAQVRAYLTLNTLLYDHDLAALDKLLSAAAAEKVDAVIAADMACILRARALGLEVHLSTQLSVSNYPAFAFYAQYCDRIVLARELTLPMIRKIHRQARDNDLRGPAGRPIEIEAFAHGALCIAISGRCGMSLYTDNASANRGGCTQNCRKAYHVTDPETGQTLEIDNQYVLSPNDISTLDFLDQVIDAGVHTLKIEGRGRSPEYVSTVIAAYREALSQIAAQNYSRDSIAPLDARIKSVYHRGHSSGYYLGRKQGWSAANGSKATHQKVQAGKVTHYYPKLEVAEITATRALQCGQEFIIVGPRSGVVRGQLQDLRVDDNQPTDHIAPHQVFTVKTDKPVRCGDAFFLNLPVATPEQATR